MADENHGGTSLGVRCAILIMPIVITARLLELRFPRPLAWGTAMLAWMLIIYWFPSRSALSLKKWLLIVGLSTTFAVLTAIAMPDWYNN
jgi:hypothetical protein